MEDNNPWMGLNSYNEPSKDASNKRYLFCGRQKETFELVQLIEHNAFVTLYGKTGIGKTSLLRAGVFPILRHHYDHTVPDKPELPSFYPIHIRLKSPTQLKDQEVDTSSKPLSEVLILCIEHELKTIQQKEQLSSPPKPCDLKYLWFYFHAHKFNDGSKNVSPVIVLDQFEELFAKQTDEEKVTLFLSQLYLLVENHLPWSVSEGYNYPYCRFVISIRDDRFFYLEDVIDREHLNIFKENRYRLRALDDTNAMEVVTIPGKDVIEEDDKEEIAKIIIEKAKDTERGEINTLMLSLICQRLYKKDKKISKEDATNIKMTLDSFYTEAMSDIPIHEQKYIERNFINEDKRQPVKLDEFKTKAPIAYERLFNDAKSLYRIITTIVVPGNNVPHVELIHDQIASVMNARRKSQQNRRRIKYLRFLLVACVLFLGLGLLFEGGFTNNKYRQNFGLTRIDDHRFSTEDSIFIPQSTLDNNAMVEDLALIDKSQYSISRCHFLKSLDLRYIGHDTLTLNITDCERLEQIVLPQSLSLLNLSIKNCPKLLLQVNKGLGSLYINPMPGAITIKIDSDVDRYTINDGVLWDVTDRRIVYYPGIGSEDAPKTIICKFPETIKDESKSYGNTLFNNNNYKHDESIGITSTGYLDSPEQINYLVDHGIPYSDNCDRIVLPDSLDSIPTSLFKDHFHLQEVQMPKSLKEIHSEAFMQCIKIKTIDLSDNLQFIGKRAFMGCTKLTHITIPASVKRIEDQAFEGCSSLESVDFLGDTIELGNRAFANCQILKISKLPKINFKSGYEYESPFYNCLNVVNVESLGHQLIPNKKKTHKDYDVFTTSSGLLINPKQNVTEIYLPLERTVGRIEFESNIKNITDIHIPWPQPYSYVNKEKKSLILNIAPNEQQHITLHVPFGCRRYYYFDNQFDGYKDIIEDTPTQRVKDWGQYLLSQTWTLMTKHVITLLLLFILFLVWTSFPLLSKIEFLKNGFAAYRQSRLRVYLTIAGNAIVSFLCCMLLYWIFRLLFRLNVNASQFWALVITLSLTTLYFMVPVIINHIKNNPDTKELKKSRKESVNSAIKLIHRFINKYIKLLISVFTIVLVTLLFFLNHNFWKTRTSHQDQQEVLLSFIDSLVRSDAISETDIQQLSHHLAICGDSMSLILTKTIPYDQCDPNYEWPYIFPDYISMVKGDTLYMYDSQRMVQYPITNDPFGRGNQARLPDLEFSEISFYDDYSDSTALILISEDSRTVKIPGEIETLLHYSNFVLSHKKDGHRYLSDFDGHSLLFDENISMLTDCYTHMTIIETESASVSNRNTYLFVSGETGITRQQLPSGSANEVLFDRYLIWRVSSNDNLYAYDLKNPNQKGIIVINGEFKTTPDGSTINIYDQYPSCHYSVNSQQNIILNCLTKQEYPLPPRYRNLNSYSSGDLNERYYYINNIPYNEIAIFDMQENGKIIAELTGKNISKIESHETFSQNETSFFKTSNDSISFYSIINGTVY